MTAILVDTNDDSDSPEVPRKLRSYGKKNPRSRAALTAYEEKLEREQESQHDDIYEEDGQYG